MGCNFQSIDGPKIVFMICSNHTDREAVFPGCISLSILDMTGAKYCNFQWVLGEGEGEQKTNTPYMEGVGIFCTQGTTDL